MLFHSGKSLKSSLTLPFSRVRYFGFAAVFGTVGRLLKAPLSHRLSWKLEGLLQRCGKLSFTPRPIRHTQGRPEQVEGRQARGELAPLVHIIV